MIKIPKEYNYAEAYFTLRCNFNCDYCINDKDGIKRNRNELTPKQWAEGLNKIDFGNVSLTIGGGEPTIRGKDFYELLDLIKPETKIDLLTNLSFDVDEFIRRVKPSRFTTPTKPFYHPIRVSYHVNNTDQDTTIEKAKKLQENGFGIGIFGLSHPYYINNNMEMAWKCNRAGVPFYTKDFLGEVDGRMYGFFKYPKGLDGIVKNAICRTRELLIGPEGNIYRCHRDLYHAENPIGNITKDFTIEYRFRGCKNYGLCNPCDVKLKTNKFLREVECQVEIKQTMQ